MYRHIPNMITVGRLLLTALFFIAINVRVSTGHFTLLMSISLVLFLLATGSDVLDGYLARTWKVESAFGRVVDPFADKILICGAFVFLCTPVIPMSVVSACAWPALYAPTGIAPWMAVVLIAREFLVTGIRGLAESRGIDFRAQWMGKLKMLFQSIAVGGALVCFMAAIPLHGSRLLYGLLLTRDVAIWLTILITVVSAWQYIVSGWRVMRPA